jgi:hypothetical protein
MADERKPGGLAGQSPALNRHHNRQAAGPADGLGGPLRGLQGFCEVLCSLAAGWMREMRAVMRRGSCRFPSMTADLR